MKKKGGKGKGMEVWTIAYGRNLEGGSPQMKMVGGRKDRTNKTLTVH